MPIIRIDPPKRGRNPSTGAAKGAAAGLVSGGPIGAIIGGIQGAFAPRDGARHNVPIEVNTDTGTVIALVQERGQHHGRERDLASQQRKGDMVAPILERIYRTGVMEKVPSQYQETARVVQQLAYSNPYTPAAPDYSAFDDVVERSHAGRVSKPEPEEDFFMGGFLPPGGLAGFSQMMPASKLALTRGGRGRTTGTRRRKKRTKRRAAAKRPRAAKKRARKVRGKRKLVKGSAAAKRYMASIRRKRRA